MRTRSIVTGLAVAVALSAGVANATSVSLSIGSGGLLNPSEGKTASVAPLATELTVGFNIAPNVTLDAAFQFARDISDPYNPNISKQSYVGFRPGLRAYAGFPFSNLRPYFRAAVPVQYNSEAKTLDLGLLVGGGLEYRVGRTLGVFGEAIVSPYLTNDRLVPIEGRVGVSVHF